MLILLSEGSSKQVISMEIKFVDVTELVELFSKRFYNRNLPDYTKAIYTCRNPIQCTSITKKKKVTGN